jgi:hypothetical protein
LTPLLACSSDDDNNLAASGGTGSSRKFVYGDRAGSGMMHTVESDN